MGGGRRLATRVALVFLGLAVGLLAAELALQIGSFFVGLRGPAEWSAAGRPLRLLFLGDSNTYGIYVDPSEAYPRVLEKEWNRQPAATPVEVLNLGFPGTNSSKGLL